MRNPAMEAVQDEVANHVGIRANNFENSAASGMLGETNGKFL